MEPVGQRGELQNISGLSASAGTLLIDRGEHYQKHAALLAGRRPHYPLLRLALPERVPTIDDQVVAGRISRGVRSEEDNGTLIVGRDA